MDGKGKKVLVVDDEEGVRLQLVTILKKVGFETFEASDGVEGREMSHSIKPDIVITDIHMPNLGGIELIRALKYEDNRPIIIAVSAKWIDDKGDHLKEAKEVEADEVLAKPILKEILLRKIEKHL